MDGENMETKVGKTQNHPIVEALIKRIIELKEKGETWESLAEQVGHGASHTTIRRWALRENPPNSIETATAAFLSLGGDLMAALEDEIALVALVSIFSKLSETEKEAVAQRIKNLSPEKFLERLGISPDDTKAE